MRHFLAIALCMGQLSLCGCAAIFFDESENVTFSSSPDRAEIRLDGMPVGRTPQMLNLKAKDYGVQFNRKGCEPYMTSLNADTSGGAVAATVLGVLGWGVFELLSLAEGTGIYRDMPDTVYGNLTCKEGVGADEDE